MAKFDFLKKIRRALRKQQLPFDVISLYLFCRPPDRRA